MIKIPVDEGYAYDFLAILEVKMVKMNKGKDYYLVFFEELAFQVGREKHSKIIQSPEYQECILANQETFDAVESARYGQVSAKQVDDCNMRRYNAKIALQKRFFGGDVVEIKS